MAGFLSKAVGFVKDVKEKVYSSTVKIASLPDASQKVGTSRPELHVDQMENSLKEVSSYPLLIVAISGEFRSGKSFALNLMTTYLEFLEKLEVFLMAPVREHGAASMWAQLKSVTRRFKQELSLCPWFKDTGNPKSWINSGVEIKGVQWARSSKAVTRGIWMWRKPFVLTRSDGSKVAIILFDCQGTGDVENSSLYLDTLITYISLQLSNVQILNLRNQMKADDLTRLEMCTDYADAVSDDTDESDQHIFDRLIYLQRNWEADDDYGEREEAEFTKLIEAETTSHEVRKAGQGIKKAFRKVSVFALPHPGKKVAKADEVEHVSSKSATTKYGNLCVKEDDIDREFLEAAKEMFDKMFLDEAEDRHLPLASKVMDEFKLLGERIAKADLSIGSPAASLHETLAYKAFVASRDFFENTVNMEFQMQGQNSMSTEEIEQKMNDLWGRVEDHYKRGYKFDKFGETDAYRRYWEMLENTWKNNKTTKLAFGRHKDAVAQANKKARLVEEYSRKVAENERERLAEVIKAAQEKEANFAKVMAEEAEKRKADHARIREEANQKVQEQIEAARREFEQREEQRAVEEKERLDQQEESLKQAELARINAEKKQREEAELLRRKLEEEKAAAAAEAQRLVDELKVKKEAMEAAHRKLALDKDEEHKKELEKVKRRQDEERQKEKRELMKKEADAEQARADAEEKRKLAAVARDNENEAIEDNMFIKGCKNLGTGAVDLVSGVGQLVISPFVGLWKAIF